MISSKQSAVEDLLLSLSVLSEAELNGRRLAKPVAMEERERLKLLGYNVPRIESEPHAMRMRIDRAFRVLVQQGYGDFVKRTRRRAKSEKFFIPSLDGRKRVLMFQLGEVLNSLEGETLQGFMTELELSVSRAYKAHHSEMLPQTSR